MAKSLGSTKTGGRKKGTPNKKTLDLQESLRANNIDIISQIALTLPQLSPDKRADVLLDLMNYVYPKRKAIEMDADISLQADEASTEAELDKRLKEAKKNAMSLARRLILLDEAENNIGRDESMVNTTQKPLNS